jgi:hypothetical protein
VFIVHFAYSVVAIMIGVEKLNTFVNNESEYHPEKPYPVFVGAVGCVAMESYTTVWPATPVPPLLLNVTANVLIAHLAYKVTLAVAIAKVPPPVYIVPLPSAVVVHPARL